MPLSRETRFWIMVCQPRRCRTMKATSIPSQDVMMRLREETRHQQRNAEAIPFSRALILRALPCWRYVGQLRALYTIHRALESALAASAHPTVTKVWHDGLCKRALLADDLEFFAPFRHAEDIRAARAAHRFAQRIGTVARAAPVALLGYLYVLEGATLGTAVVHRHVAEAYGLEQGSGLAYYRAYGNDVRSRWHDFKARMNAAVEKDREQDLVVQGAREGYRYISAVLGALSADLPPLPVAPAMA
ncbi:MAG: biliverdin-producing heme oxygenase [Myxococcales bacterium FL481]|nr:MAG: biliverdin-producing heme oxygenase [Myxococcales bacterium FL481]